MSKIDMVALRAAFKKNEQSSSAGQNNYYPFYNMDMGELAEIRFLPDRNEDNPMGFLIEKKMHTLVINGDKKSIVCPKTWGTHEACPICKLSSAYYKKDDKDNGKLYYRKLQYIGQVLVISDPLPKDKDTGENHEGKTRYIALGNQLYDVIKDTFEGGYLKVPPFLFEGGYNFHIRKSEKILPDKRKVAAYHTSRFLPEQSDLNEKTIAHVQSTLIDLSSLPPKKPEIDKLEAMLEASLNGQPIKMDEQDTQPDHDDTPVQVVTNVKEAVAASTTTAPAKQEVTAAPSAAAKAADNPESRKILEGLAERRRQQQAAKQAQA